MEAQELEYCIDRLVAGDSRSQSVFYRHCYLELMKVCLRYHTNQDDAAVSFNTAMLQVFQKIATYRREGNVMGWVRRIVVNTCISQLRKQVNFQAKEVTEAEENNFSVDPSVYGNIDVPQLLKMVQDLPGATRTVFNLFVVDGFTHQQIAEELKISTGTSRWHLASARNLLKEQLMKLDTHETVILQK
ncbi:MAG: polymerase, sigma-24 subunit, subfamily [Chitinophagaceae bacterium]|jgi:RNA polymerase sigma-70 factor (ECF subfamily)|nr:polymerase, sigma-24 subunit, subfamily [Chitinophagaceae bacterium]